MVQNFIRIPRRATGRSLVEYIEMMDRFSKRITPILIATPLIFGVVTAPVMAQDSPLPEMSAIEQAYAEGDFETARNGLRVLAESGNSLAQYRYGLILTQGQDQEPDPAGAIEWLERATAARHIEAEVLLAKLLMAGVSGEPDMARAAEHFSNTAARGNISAQYELGQMYRNGLGVEQDAAQAQRWFYAASDQDHAPAKFALSQMIKLGEGSDADPVAAEAMLRDAASGGHLAAQLSLAISLQSGDGIAQNPTEALEWLNIAAEGGSALALRLLGSRYLTGDGVDEDHAKALEMLTAAARADEPGAQTNLGFMYATGTGVDADDEKAVAWYERAADNGLIRAKTALAQLHEQGRGPNPSMDTAVELYKEAAEFGDARAAAQLGRMVVDGRVGGGFPSNEQAHWVSRLVRVEAEAETVDSAALNWMVTKAGEDVPRVQVLLAELYLSGISGELTNDAAIEDAVTLLTKAAGKEDPRAYYRLGQLNAAGDGPIPQDLIKAHAWYNLAAARGLEQAVEQRDVVALLLSPDQVAEAQARARTLLTEIITQ